MPRDALPEQQRQPPGISGLLCPQTSLWIPVHRFRRPPRRRPQTQPRVRGNAVALCERELDLVELNLPRVSSACGRQNDDELFGRQVCNLRVHCDCRSTWRRRTQNSGLRNARSLSTPSTLTAQHMHSSSRHRRDPSRFGACCSSGSSPTVGERRPRMLPLRSRVMLAGSLLNTALRSHWYCRPLLLRLRFLLARQLLPSHPRIHLSLRRIRPSHRPSLRRDCRLFRSCHRWR